MAHAHDTWMIRIAPDGSKYCAACGETTSPAPLITIDALAAAAAIQAGSDSSAADTAHEEAYSRYRRVAEAAGVLEKAETEGLTLAGWLRLIATDGKDGL